MIKAPKSLRLQIALFGRTNVGKSSFLNMVANQDVSITSETPGTTTDVVEKSMELLPIGPVNILDTGGIDDVSELAEQRIERTMRILDRGDVFVLITEGNKLDDYEKRLLDTFREKKLNYIIVVNKIDQLMPNENYIDSLQKINKRVLLCSTTDIAKRESYVTAFKHLLLEILPHEFTNPSAIIGDLLPPGGTAVLIIPIDKEAPKGRIILPQVQTIRDLLDHGQISLMVRETEYSESLKLLKNPPDLVVCDSQVVDKMIADTPDGIKCTTFSILFSRFKGNLMEELKGIAAIDKLEPGDKILISEACSHHPNEDDIGRVKIPRWLRNYLGFEVEIDVRSGRDYPENLEDYKAIIHCGGCMLTRNEKLVRIDKAKIKSVPITNYGLLISHMHGVLGNVLEPFREEFDYYRSIKQIDF
jgi:[FeFe] hydrogenase H-cluster maturation GTPase HydF